MANSEDTAKELTRLRDVANRMRQGDVGPSSGTFLDELPEVDFECKYPDQKNRPEIVDIEATVRAGDYENTLKFQIDARKLVTGRPENQAWLQNIIRAREAHMDNSHSRLIALERLIVIALGQGAPGASLAQRRQVARRMLLLPPLPPEQPTAPPGSSPPKSSAETDLVGVFLDCLPLPGQQLLFHAIILRHEQRSHIDFRLSQTALAKLGRERLERLQWLLDRPPNQPEDSSRILSVLLDASLQESGVDYKEERDQQVRDLMLYGSKPKPIPPTRDGYGVSPGLLFINRKTRARLWREHRINVNTLQQESERLYRDLDRWWEVVPQEDIELSDRYFPQAARAFDRLSLAHHEKVKHVGELLKGDIGNALITQAEWIINKISARL